MSRDSLFEAIKQECTKLPPDRDLTWKRNGTQAWIRCPWHGGGMEATGSLKISCDPAAPTSPGHAYCFGCQVKKPWNTVAALFGLRQFGSGEMREATDESSYLRHLDFNSTENTVPDLGKMSRWPLDVPWRDIRGTTVGQHEGCSVIFGNRPWLYLPVKIYCEHVGGIYARLSRDRSNKREKAYLNDLDSGAALYGFDQARSTPGALWVVEGPRDALWINQCGGRAVGLIGSAVTARKLDLIRDLDPASIVVATDPDAAGEKASDALYAALDSELPLVRFPFRNTAEDPCDLEPARVARACQLMQRYED